jgi:hydrogenase maturation protease
MNIDTLVTAVLYEGYILYPYRADSTKNRRRFTFGRVYPHDFVQAGNESERCSVQTQCLVEKRGDAIITVTIRFLHPMNRMVGKLSRPLTHWADDLLPEIQSMAELRVEDRIYQSWQEAVEQTINPPPLLLREQGMPPLRFPFRFRASHQTEPIRDGRGRIVGVVERYTQAIEGVVEIRIEPLARALFKVTASVHNLTPFHVGDGVNTEDETVLMRTMASTHMILTVREGAFISMIDPPEKYQEQTASCHNEGVFPVLVGEDGQADTLLASPIILYDYPEIAPESHGDLFDSTEIDEILSLRIMTMTDEEKAAMRQLDERSHQILQRTESLQADDLWRMHGTQRSLHPSDEDTL